MSKVPIIQPDQSYTFADYEIWLETCLIPRLRPGEWVILDNATFTMVVGLPN